MSFGEQQLFQTRSHVQALKQLMFRTKQQKSRFQLFRKKIPQRFIVSFPADCRRPSPASHGRPFCRRSRFVSVATQQKRPCQLFRKIPKKNKIQKKQTPVPRCQWRFSMKANYLYKYGHGVQILQILRWKLKERRVWWTESGGNRTRAIQNCRPMVLRLLKVFMLKPIE